ncbi:MAG: hypothetical protein US49_C0007G0018 [candidate division TM6 bacterium GW2011_GWF2_37_49]|nr:MAG: hypothetical protein US49_C0007G0018 [candidate division TM6 bacterium GW2011_GWF2_37_49]
MLDFFRKYKVCLSKVLLTALALGFAPGIFAAVADDTKSSSDLGIFERISRLYMPSLVGTEKEEVLQENEKLASRAIPMTVGGVESLKLAYEILSAPYLREGFGEFKKKQLLDDCVFSDLEIFCGKDGSPSLFSKIDFTVTPFGKAKLQSLFMQKYDVLGENVDHVLDLQRKVKVLVENEELFNRIDARLLELKNVFGDLLWMWKPLSDASMNFIDQAYYSKIDIDLGDKKFEIDMRGWNKKPFMLSSLFAFFTWGSLFGFSFYYIYRLFKDTRNEEEMSARDAKHEWALHLNALGTLGGSKSSTLTAKIREDYDFNLEDIPGGDFEALKDNAFFNGCRKGPIPASWHYAMYLKERGSFYLAKYNVYAFAAFCALIMHIYSSFRSDRYFKDVFKAVRQKMKQLSLFYSNMSSFEESLKGVDVFTDLLGCYDKNKKRFAPEKQRLAFESLFNDLVTSSEYKNPSFFSGKGKILADFKRFLDLKSNLVSSLLLVGEIDMLMSLAKLYKANAKHPTAKYCFAKFVNADLPYINIKDFWHPLIHPDDAKVNSIELGTPEAGRGGIVTGPNAAGKSSSLKGIHIAVTLAHIIGMCPASSIELTWFAKISSHLNVSDAQGQASLFQAEMNRALTFLGEVNKLGKGEFMFTILDELFSSTNPEEGMSGAYGIVKSLADHPQCMSILATHFKKLTELEAQTGGFFKNYKVYVEVFADRSFRPTFKLVPGISDQSMALLLMQKHGFSKQVVKDAYNVLVQVKDDRRNILMPEGFVESY